MPEPQQWPDQLTRAERAALIQANLQLPQVHHPTCICCKPRAEKP